MDITETIAPKSDQVNADDLIRPVTVTVAGVNRGDADQPVNIELVEFPGRAYRPCKSMRRVLVFAWGADASAYTGRRMTLFNDPAVKWGGAAVGGIRISHLSHIDKPLTISLTETRGKRKPHRVEPLPDEPPPDADDAITKPQLQKLSILRQREGYTDDDQGREDWFQWVQTNIGRLVGTNKDLSKAEASVLIDVLESDEDQSQ